MTREMAIQVLQTALTAPFIYGEYAEAINMAIEALQVKTEGDPISRQGAIDCVRWGDSVTNVINRINALPSADRPPGRWVNRERCQVDEDAYEVATCSECGAEITIEYPHDSYCPNCGTKMEGK